ncbi:hypothetical protein BUALT_Bualt19G0044000 [Buddleja alternifolia]|uniref:Uncharacterized protein n=1 Tax=Buddleja alternifolia TaxID=168488 RepID=A0AAV6W1K7_9LAMI|nr:hypothetical protein BUALT_Bualt19G0044000 [Buddleja alternifolia]
MGRGKIEIKKIENANSRQVTFSKRRGGLFKKARELAILCDCDVAVIIYSSTGKPFEFSSCSMKKILSRYTKCMGSEHVSAREMKPEKRELEEVDVLKEEMEKLKAKHRQMLGKDLTSLSLQEVHALEQQLNEGLLLMKDKKAQLLLQELTQSKMTVEEFRDFFPITNPSMPLCIDYGSMEKGSPVLERGSESPGTACNEDSDTALYLGLSSGISKKGKTPDGETHSSNSETQVNLSL